MFSNKGRDKDIAPAVAQGTSPANGIKRSGRTSAPSIISADLVVNGTLTSTGDIQIDGRVEGNVHSSGLVIGDKACVQGEIYADDVTIRGKVEGSIHARRVVLCATCHVEGNILHEAFSVEAGAFFEGNCRHADNANSADAARRGAETSGGAPLLPLPPRSQPDSAGYTPLKNGTAAE